MVSRNHRSMGRAIRGRNTPSEAAIDITEVNTTRLGDGRARVTATVRVFNVGFDTVPYEGLVELSHQRRSFDTAQISGEAGAGGGADEKTVELETDTTPPGEATLTASLTNGDQEQQTVLIPQEDPGIPGTEPFEIVSCSTGRAFNDGLSVEFAVDGTGGESFTATINVDRQEVDSQSWTLSGVPPTSFNQIVDPSDLPIGEEMPVELGVEGNL